MAWDYVTAIDGFPAAEATDVAVGPEGESLAVTYKNNGLWVGDVTGGYESAPERFHTQTETTFQAVTFSADGQSIIASWYGDLFIFDRNGTLVERTDDVGGGTYRDVVSTSEHLVANGTDTDDFELAAYEHAAPDYEFSWAVADTIGAETHAAGIDEPRSNYFVTSSGTINAFDTATGADPWTLDTTITHTDISGTPLPGLDVTSDHLVVAARDNNQAAVFNPSDHSHQATYTDPTGAATDVAAAHTRTAVASADGSTYVYDLTTDSLLETLSDASAAIDAVAFDLGNQCLVSAARDGSVHVHTTDLSFPQFRVAITGTNQPVDRGDTLNVFYTVENIGGALGEQTVELEIRGNRPTGYGFAYGNSYGSGSEYSEITEDSETISLDGGEAHTSILSWSGAEYGTFDAAVLSEDSVTVREVTIADVHSFSGTASISTGATGALAIGDAVELTGTASITTDATGTPEYTFGEIYDFEATASISTDASSEPVTHRHVSGTATIETGATGTPHRARTLAGRAAITTAAPSTRAIVRDTSIPSAVPIRAVTVPLPTAITLTTTTHPEDSSTIIMQVPREQFPDRTTEESDQP